MQLPESAGDVVLGVLRLGVREHVDRSRVLDQLAEPEEGGLVRDARRLLQVVRHDDDRVLRLELLDQLLDLQRGDRIERRAGLVHQDDLRLDRDRARDAQPLLLAARERQAALVQPVLDLVPERRAAQARSHASSSVALSLMPAMRSP